MQYKTKFTIRITAEDDDDNNTTNPLFDQSNRTDHVMEILDNDEMLKHMWPIVREYSENVNFNKNGKL